MRANGEAVQGKEATLKSREIEQMTICVLLQRKNAWAVMGAMQKNASLNLAGMTTLRKGWA